MTRRFGTVRRLNSGRYQAIHQSEVTGDRQVARSFDTKRQAEDWLAEERTRLRHGDWVNPSAGDISLNDYFETWLLGRTLAPRTVELYEWLWRRCLADDLGRRRLSQLSPVIVRAWHASLVRAERPGPTTVAKSYRLLSAVVGDAVRDGALVRNPCTVVGAGVEHRRRINVLSIADIERIAAVVPDRFRALVLVAGYGGLRWGEAVGLWVSDVDLEGGRLTVQRVLSEALSGALSFGPPKTAAGYRTVALPASVVAELSRHLDRFTVGELVFTTSTGLPLRRPNFTATWKRVLRTIDLEDVRFHDLRHAAATLATSHGATVREVQARLGHASPTAALRYQHVIAGADVTLATRLDAARRRAEVVS